MSAAFKEWAVVVRALLEGEQVIVLRKGGIREEGRKFSVPHDRFWLYPTYEHQDASLVKPAYQWSLAAETATAPPPGVVRVPGWAEVAAIRRTFEPSALADLDGSHIWTTDYATTRLRWKRREALWVIALRAYRLDEPFSVPYDESYGGCSSWLTWKGEVREPEGGRPALSDTAFAARLDRILSMADEPQD
jgi:hypothetical protein